MRDFMRRLAHCAAACSTLLALAGCASVQPDDAGLSADDAMEDEMNDQSLEDAER